MSNIYGGSPAGKEEKTIAVTQGEREERGERDKAEER